MTPRGRSIDAVRWTDDHSVDVTRTTLNEADLDWLKRVRRLTLWSVKMTDGLLAKLPDLEWLDIRSATATTDDLVRGCTGLQFLALHHVRGMRDLSAIADLQSLELLSLYGMPQVVDLPSLSQLPRLLRVEIGSMKGLSSIAPVLDAPALRELLLIRTVGHDERDAERVRDTGSLEAFDWFAEDVPDRIWIPFSKTVAKPKARAMHPHEWFAG